MVRTPKQRFHAIIPPKISHTSLDLAIAFETRQYRYYSHLLLTSQSQYGIHTITEVAAMGVFDRITAVSTAAKGQLDKLVSPERQHDAYAFLLADRPVLLVSQVPMRSFLPV